MISKEINSSSANAQSNGWTFQYVAALVIYLEKIGEAQLFCVEGTDDIVIFLRDNRKICAQAKSSLEQDSIIRGHFDDVIESIRTLSANKDACELISVSNFHSPLGKNDGFSFFQFLDKKKFSDLSTKTQTKITNEINNKGYCIDLSNFKLWFIRFEGDDPCLGLFEYLKNKLMCVDSSQYFPINDIMSQWLAIIQLNARDKKNNISTDIMCGTLFGKILNTTSLDRILDLINMEIDPCYEEYFDKFFKDYFSKNVQNFKIYSKITSDFYEFVNFNKPKINDQYKLFVDQYCRVENIPIEMLHYFDNDEELSLNLYKTFIAYVCYKKNIVKSIREVFNYEYN